MEKEQINQLLIDRELKSKTILNYVNDFTVITLKANIPGINKNIKEAYILLSYFDKLISKFKIIKKIYQNSSDGPYIIYLLDCDASIKQQMIDLEEHHSLGRFVDLDVFDKTNKSISRGFLRKCYLCNNYAFVCGKNKTHTLEQLLNYIKDAVLNKLSVDIKTNIKEAMLKELNLHPKFGLITPYTNGSHHDMTYQMMYDSVDVVTNGIYKMFEYAINCDNLDVLFKEIRKIGLDTELKMYKVTNNINTYKGLIFDLGLLCASVGYKISHHICANIFEIVKYMTKGLTKELENNTNTYGKKAYDMYNIKGAREEAECGFINVQRVLEKNLLETDSDLREGLCELIFNCDDTVFLKRCKNLNKYYKVKEMFRNTPLNEENIEKLNSYCIEENLSFGGCADLLICSIFLKNINKILSLDLK